MYVKIFEGFPIIVEDHSALNEDGSITIKFDENCIGKTVEFKTYGLTNVIGVPVTVKAIQDDLPWMGGYINVANISNGTYSLSVDNSTGAKFEVKNGDVYKAFDNSVYMYARLEKLALAMMEHMEKQDIKISSLFSQATE